MCYQITLFRSTISCNDVICLNKLVHLLYYTVLLERYSIKLVIKLFGTTGVTVVTNRCQCLGVLLIIGFCKERLRRRCRRFKLMVSNTHSHAIFLEVLLSRGTLYSYTSLTPLTQTNEVTYNKNIYLVRYLKICTDERV